ncbi:alpha/beta hydrolase [Halosquirtibacter laminarini]|uniref:Alpha/beta hydrolase n=1 Tax=Halosquirtibacter laminarini TaxID=3374600 RepID=A0AC61NI00_9BACT|nr:alpha/beta hydrolase [Prolixibacteraceae bacterium]
MNVNKIKLILLLFCSLFLYSFGRTKGKEIQVIYKQIGDVQLEMNVFYPENFDQSKSYPAIVFFSGGGWLGMNINQFRPQAQHFAKKGFICFTPKYRTAKHHGTGPTASLKDAKSAMRYIKGNADSLHVNTDHIIASGGSAGGHLAAACALIEGHNEETDDLSISTIPSALVLFNPVIDNSSDGYGYKRLGCDYKTFSPLHNIKKGAPPTLFLLGTKDHLIPVQTAELYQKKMTDVGAKCKVVLYKDQEHGFFNYKFKENYLKTINEMEEFLLELGYKQFEPSNLAIDTMVYI